MLALSLHWAKLRQMCCGIAHACVRFVFAVVWVSQLATVFVVV